MVGGFGSAQLGKFVRFKILSLDMAYRYTQSGDIEKTACLKVWIKMSCINGGALKQPF